MFNIAGVVEIPYHEYPTVLHVAKILDFIDYFDGVPVSQSPEKRARDTERAAVVALAVQERPYPVQIGLSLALERGESA